MIFRMLGRNFIKWRQRPDITKAVDLDIEQQIQQLNANSEAVVRDYSSHN